MNNSLTEPNDLESVHIGICADPNSGMIKWLMDRQLITDPCTRVIICTKQQAAEICDFARYYYDKQMHNL